MRFLRFAGRVVRSVVSIAVGVIPALVRDAVGLLGAAAIAYGSWLVYVPAGYIVAGVLLILFAILTAPRSQA
ncbi:hypothetical protein Rleg9DRAFT_1707 [Rhizobium leguminosarum bv. trifolii WSM597]|uniref:Uncharacterized protein n=1 Tax=Rhizobium leguminosarum bv. trifolii WSM597 TaxID=754764 RepID=J0GZ78_RHILT|nr:hypothetical protein [Rhizobium leguminosarum]EJB02893.1 hypothetical protein Rleg9DRAFT_1707 [Rhizobium leguminosarum bv. trifolii WSM597]